MMKYSFGCHGQQPCFWCDVDRVVFMNEDASSEFTPRIHEILYHPYTISSICFGNVKPAIVFRTKL
jgi:hypothetical protein